MAQTPIVGQQETVVLGACDIYLGDYEGGALDMAAFTSDEENYFGNTQGGTTLEYTQTTYTVEDDRGRIRRVFQTKAEATLKTGLLTYDVSALFKTLSVGTITTNDGATQLLLPGGKATLKRKIVVAVYTDDETGEVTRIGMIAANTGGLQLAYAKDKESVPELTFTALANDKDGNIVVIEQVSGSTDSESSNSGSGSESSNSGSGSESSGSGSGSESSGSGSGS